MNFIGLSIDIGYVRRKRNEIFFFPAPFSSG